MTRKKVIAFVAKPMGVVGAVTPCTNPVVTPMCNAMFALKGRNAIIIAPHPRAKKCGKYVVDLFNAALAKLGAPDGLIQIIEEPSIELTNELMRKADVVVATGGMAMVKSAYSSGKPAFGVGVGNVQVIIDDDADIKEAIPKIVTGRAFDNGIICSAEQTVMVPEAKYEQVLAEFEKNFCHVIRDDRTEGQVKGRSLYWRRCKQGCNRTICCNNCKTCGNRDTGKYNGHCCNCNRNWTGGSFMQGKNVSRSFNTDIQGF